MARPKTSLEAGALDMAFVFWDPVAACRCSQSESNEEAVADEPNAHPELECFEYMPQEKKSVLLLLLASLLLLVRHLLLEAMHLFLEVSCY